MTRRIVDVVVALAVLVILGPLLLLIALAIVIDSRGGAIYFAPRAGKDGKIFAMWKFRTMTAGASKEGLITGPHDRRITRIGHVLRRTKLDELPQFVNVLLGDMTLVGPRPETPEIVALYTAEQRAVLRVQPGITGEVQLESGCEADSIPEGVPAEQYYVQQLMNRKLARDLEYLKTKTAWSDARVVLATALLVMRSVLHR